MIKHFLVKKLISYLFQINILKTTGEHGETLEVNLDAGQLLLDSKNSNYSYGNLERVFAQSFKEIDWSKTQIQKILSLGFGAGCNIPLLRDLGINAPVVGLEYDAKVIEIFEQYFKSEKHSPLEVIHQDALEFLNSTSDQYELILVDLFQDIKTHDSVLSYPFLQLLKSHLQSNGIIIINTIAINQEEQNSIEVIEKQLNQLFTSVKLIKVQDFNRVFILN